MNGDAKDQEAAGPHKTFLMWWREPALVRGGHSGGKMSTNMRKTGADRDQKE